MSYQISSSTARYIYKFAMDKKSVIYAIQMILACSSFEVLAFSEQTLRGTYYTRNVFTSGLEGPSTDSSLWRVNNG